MFQQPPQNITGIVKDFCQEVSPGSIPQYLFPMLIKDAEDLDCFQNVDKQAKERGGSIQYGWRIWEWPRVMIEAEFHAVWVNAEGRFIDLEAQGFPFKRVLFLPDTKRLYEGKQVDNIRRPLNEDPIILDFIRSHQKMFQLMNEGELANYHGPVVMTNEMQQETIIQQKLSVEIIKKYA